MKIFDNNFDNEEIVDPLDSRLAEDLLTFHEVIEIDTDVAIVRNLTDIELRSLLKRSKNTLTRNDIASITSALKTKLALIKQLQSRLDVVKTSIVSEVDQANKNSISQLKTVVTNDKTVKRAIKSSFGKKTNIITFQMYREALDTLEILDSEESKEYVSGNWVEK